MSHEVRVLDGVFVDVDGVDCDSHCKFCLGTIVGNVVLVYVLASAVPIDCVHFLVVALLVACNL